MLSIRLLIVLAFLTGPAAAQAPPPPGFGVTLGADNAVYNSGDLIRITFEVFNNTAEPVSLDFRSSQRYDFVIEDQQQKEVWRWSAGRMFAQALGTETLGPNRPRLTYQETCADKMEPGTYTIQGLLTDANRRPSATTRIVVR